MSSPDYHGYCDPQTGFGFDAPTPAEAYTDAPPILEESAELLTQSSQYALGHWDGDEERQRAYLLRRAALADRCALQHPGQQQFLSDAVTLSQQLKKWDTQHPRHVQGPISPRSPEWDPSARPYVRQEWVHRTA
jgi:hypothetical protein